MTHADQPATQTGAATTILPMPSPIATADVRPDEEKAVGRVAKRAARGAGRALSGGVIIGVNGVRWDPRLHPRDSKGRFIETGGVAKVWGTTRRGRVVRSLGRGRVELQFRDGHREVYDSSRLTMESRPNGQAPTSNQKRVMREDARRAASPKRGDGRRKRDLGDWDGDGVPNSQDADPRDPKVTARKKPVRPQSKPPTKDEVEKVDKPDKEKIDASRVRRFGTGRVVAVPKYGESGDPVELGRVQVDPDRKKGTYRAVTPDGKVLAGGDRDAATDALRRHANGDDVPEWKPPATRKRSPAAADTDARGDLPEQRKALRERIRDLTDEDREDAEYRSLLKEASEAIVAGRKGDAIDALARADARKKDRQGRAQGDRDATTPSTDNRSPDNVGGGPDSDPDNEGTTDERDQVRADRREVLEDVPAEPGRADEGPEGVLPEPREADRGPRAGRGGRRPADRGLRGEQAGQGRGGQGRRGDGAGRPGVPDPREGDGESPAPRVTPAAGVGGRRAGDRDRVERPAPRFRPTGQQDLAPKGGKAKAQANIAALRTLRKLQAEDRPATPDEQRVLARWAGWGALKELLEPDGGGKYPREHAELRELLNDREWKFAEDNRLNAHYTDAALVDEVWTALDRLGFTGGDVLEPGSGSGNFIGRAPDGVKMTGVEVDPITAAISKHLYPDADVIDESFADVRFSPDSFDAVVGNVPFGSYKLLDPEGNPGRKHAIHNHFILKSLQALKPGGVQAVITSTSTMDGSDVEARRKIHKDADLIGAIRLPAKAHQDTAGTGVVTDVLIFRKRKDGEVPGDDSWVQGSAEVTDANGDTVIGIGRNGQPGRPQEVNAYFAAHPEDVLGEYRSGGYDGIAVVSDGNHVASLREAVGRVARRAIADGRGFSARTDTGPKRKRVVTAADEGVLGVSGEKVGKDGKPVPVIQQVIDGELQDVDLPDGWARETAALLELRDLVRRQIELETTVEGDDPKIEANRRALNSKYDAYVKKFGPVTRFKESKQKNPDGTPKLDEDGNPLRPRRTSPRSLSLLRGDLVTSSEVFALEHSYDPEDGPNGSAKKSSILTERVAHPSPQITEHADSPDGAVAVLRARGEPLTYKRLAEVLDVDEDVAPDLFDGQVFESPDEPGTLVSKVDYLSDNVRQKLARAQEAAEKDPRFVKNVEALKEVIPPDAELSEMPLQMGADWIDPRILSGFARKLMRQGTEGVTVGKDEEGKWVVQRPASGSWQRNKELEESTWGTPDRSFYDLMGSILRQQHHSLKVMRKDSEGNSYEDKEASEAAREKAAEIIDAFEDYAYSDPQIAATLSKAYSDRFRAIVPRSYKDTPTRDFPGMTRTLRPHQVDAVTRALNEPANLLDHEVGSGKTYTGATIAMEMRRLGLKKKIQLVIPNHMLAQWTSEFKELYPSAKILAADSDALSGKDGRRRFAALARNGDWDAVIMTETAAQMIPMSRPEEEKYLMRQLEPLQARLRAAVASGKKARIQAAQTAIKKKEESIKEKLARRKDDGGITFESIGFDYIIADEAHAYKNLNFDTGMDGVSPPAGSGRAQDIHMKLDWMREQYGRDTQTATFMTGTPISNTLSEMYTFTRMLRPDLLEDADVADFDSWAATFAVVAGKLEMDSAGSGYTSKTRMRGFTNALGDNLRIWRTFTDTVTTRDMPYIQRPSVKGGGRQLHLADMSEDQERAKRSFKDRLLSLPRTRKPEKGDDNHLAIIGDGKAAAIDPRLMSERGRRAAGIDPDDEGSSPKVELAADKIADVWAATRENTYKVSKESDQDSDKPGALQMVMIDSSAPKAGLNAYDMLKDALVARGMDPSRIRYIQETRSSDEKDRLLEQARQGDIDVLMGSTAALGTGTNVQNRLYALHHLDGSWRPSDIEQREGRIIRQGNQHAEVEVHAYATKNTHDAKTWDMVAYKQEVLDAIKQGDYDMRGVEFADDVDPMRDFDTLAGEIADNPLVQDRREVEQQLKKLRRSAHRHRNSADLARSRAERHRTVARLLERDEQRLAQAIAARVDTRGDKFAIQIAGENSWDERASFTDRTDAAEALAARVKQRVFDADHWHQSGERWAGHVGSIGGMDVESYVRMENGGKRRKAVLRLFEAGSRSGYARNAEDALPLPPIVLGKEEVASAKGVLARVENRLASMEDEIDKKKRIRAAENEQAVEAAETARGDFPQAYALSEVERQLDLLNTLLSTDPGSRPQNFNEAAAREEYGRLKEAAAKRAETVKAQRAAELAARKAAKGDADAAPKARVSKDERQVGAEDLAERVAKAREKRAAARAARQPSEGGERRPAAPRQERPAETPRAARTRTALDQLSNADQVRLVKVAEDAGVPEGTPEEDAGRYIAEDDRLRGLRDKYGTQAVWDAASRILDENPALRTEQGRRDATRAREAQWDEAVGRAREAAGAGDWQGVLRAVDELERIDPDGSRGLPVPSLGRMRERARALVSKDAPEGAGGADAPTPDVAPDAAAEVAPEVGAPRGNVADDLVRQAQQAVADGDLDRAMDLLDEAEQADPNTPNLERVRSRARSAQRRAEIRRERDLTAPEATPEVADGEDVPDVDVPEDTVPEGVTDADLADVDVDPERVARQAGILVDELADALQAQDRGTALARVDELERLAPDYVDPDTGLGVAQMRALVDDLPGDAGAPDRDVAPEDVTPEAPAAPALRRTPDDIGSVEFDPGQVVTTVSGRSTTPFPRVDRSTNRRAAATQRRVDEWLLENAKAEADARGINHFLPEDASNITPGDRDIAEDFLFNPDSRTLDGTAGRGGLRPLIPETPAGRDEAPSGPTAAADATPDAPAAEPDVDTAERVDLDTRLVNADYYASRGQWDEAAAELDAAERENPDDPRIAEARQQTVTRRDEGDRLAAWKPATPEPLSEEDEATRQDVVDMVGRTRVPRRRGSQANILGGVSGPVTDLDYNLAKAVHAAVTQDRTVYVGSGRNGYSATDTVPTSDRYWEVTPGGRVFERHQLTKFSEVTGQVDPDGRPYQDREVPPRVIRQALRDHSVPVRQNAEAPSVESQEAPEATTGAPAAPALQRTPDGIRNGEVGMKLAAGEVVRTASGRNTTPFPKVDVTTPRRATSTEKRVDQWLIDNARAEAESRGIAFRIDETGPWPQADKDLAEAILFDKEFLRLGPAPSILRPLTRPTPEVTPEPTRDVTPDVPEAPDAPVPEVPAVADDAMDGIERRTPEALPGEKFPPTQQQQDVIDAVLAGKDTVVQAKAGAGKTTTLEAIARRLGAHRPKDKVVYIAFNASVAAEARGRMPSNTESRTGHSIAVAWAPEWMRGRLRNAKGLRRPDDVAKHLGITSPVKVKGAPDVKPDELAQAAVRTVESYAKSADDKIGREHLPPSIAGLPTDAQDAVVAAANKAWADLNNENGSLFVDYDHIRKAWALTHPDLSKPGSGLKRTANVLFLDEAQDTPPVLAKVVADQDMQKVIVGDADQAIYGFTGARDYLSDAGGDLELPLNRSWRFGAPVADAGNRFLQLLGSKDRVVGGGQSRIVEDMGDADAVLVRTNSGMFDAALAEIEAGRLVGVPKGTKSDLRSLVRSIQYLTGETSTRPERIHDDLAQYRTWDEVRQAAEKGDDKKAQTITRLVDRQGIDRLEYVVSQLHEQGEEFGDARVENFPERLAVLNDYQLSKDLQERGISLSGAYRRAGFRFGDLPEAGRYTKGKRKGEVRQGWYVAGDQEDRDTALARLRKELHGRQPDVIVSTAHKAKGLEWGRVRIGDDFPGPKANEETGELTFPDPEELRLSYVAVTRAEKELDPGGLRWVYDHTGPNGEAQDAPEATAAPEVPAEDVVRVAPEDLPSVDNDAPVDVPGVTDAGNTEGQMPGQSRIDVGAGDFDMDRFMVEQDAPAPREERREVDGQADLLDEVADVPEAPEVAPEAPAAERKPTPADPDWEAPPTLVSVRSTKAGLSEAQFVFETQTDDGHDPGFVVTKTGIDVHDYDRAIEELGWNVSTHQDNLNDPTALSPSDRTSARARMRALEKVIAEIKAARDRDAQQPATPPAPEARAQSDDDRLDAIAAHATDPDVIARAQRAREDYENGELPTDLTVDWDESPTVLTGRFGGFEVTAKGKRTGHVKVSGRDPDGEKLTGYFYSDGPGFTPSGTAKEKNDAIRDMIVGQLKSEVKRQRASEMVAAEREATPPQPRPGADGIIEADSPALIGSEGRHGAGSLGERDLSRMIESGAWFDVTLDDGDVLRDVRVIGKTDDNWGTPIFENRAGERFGTTVDRELEDGRTVQVRRYARRAEIVDGQIEMPGELVTVDLIRPGTMVEAIARVDDPDAPFGERHQVVRGRFVGMDGDIGVLRDADGREWRLRRQIQDGRHEWSPENDGGPALVRPIRRFTGDAGAPEVTPDVTPQRGERREQDDDRDRRDGADAPDGRDRDRDGTDGAAPPVGPPPGDTPAAPAADEPKDRDEQEREERDLLDEVADTDPEDEDDEEEERERRRRKDDRRRQRRKRHRRGRNRGRNRPGGGGLNGIDGGLPGLPGLPLAGAGAGAGDDEGGRGRAGRDRTPAAPTAPKPPRANTPEGAATPTDPTPQPPAEPRDAAGPDRDIAEPIDQSWLHTDDPVDHTTDPADPLHPDRLASATWDDLARLLKEHNTDSHAIDTIMGEVLRREAADESDLQDDVDQLTPAEMGDLDRRVGDVLDADPWGLPVEEMLREVEEPSKPTRADLERAVRTLNEEAIRGWFGQHEDDENLNKFGHNIEDLEAALGHRGINTFLNGNGLTGRELAKKIPEEPALAMWGMLPRELDEHGFGRFYFPGTVKMSDYLEQAEQAWSDEVDAVRRWNASIADGRIDPDAVNTARAGAFNTPDTFPDLPVGHVIPGDLVSDPDTGEVREVLSADRIHGNVRLVTRGGPGAPESRILPPGTKVGVSSEHGRHLQAGKPGRVHPNGALLHGRPDELDPATEGMLRPRSLDPGEILPDTPDGYSPGAVQRIADSGAPIRVELSNGRVLAGPAGRSPAGRLMVGEDELGPTDTPTRVSLLGGSLDLPDTPTPVRDLPTGTRVVADIDGRPTPGVLGPDVDGGAARAFTPDGADTPLPLTPDAPVRPVRAHRSPLESVGGGSVPGQWSTTGRGAAVASAPGKWSAAVVPHPDGDAHWSVRTPDGMRVTGRAGNVAAGKDEVADVLRAARDTGDDVGSLPTNPTDRRVDRPTGAPEEAPTPIGGRNAEWVGIADVGLGDTVRVVGDSHDGAPIQEAGYALSWPTPVHAARPGDAAGPERLAVVVGENPDGTGRRRVVYATPDAVAARAVSEVADTSDADALADKAESDVMTGRLTYQVPADRSGRGLFPGTLIRDSADREGVVTAARGQDLTVTWADGREDDVTASSVTALDDGQARPAGWTTDGRRVTPGTVVTLPGSRNRKVATLGGKKDERARGTVEAVTGDTVIVSTPDGVKDVPAGDLRIVGDPVVGSGDDGQGPARRFDQVVPGPALIDPVDGDVVDAPLSKADRDALVSLGFDLDQVSDPAVAQAALRIRHHAGLTGEQATALADAVDAATGPSVTGSGWERSMKRLSKALRAAAQQQPTAQREEPEAPRKVTPDDVVPGDTVAVPTGDGALEAVTVDRVDDSGWGVFGEDGQQRTIPTPEEDVHLLPDPPQEDPTPAADRADEVRAEALGAVVKDRARVTADTVGEHAARAIGESASLHELRERVAQSLTPASLGRDVTRVAERMYDDLDRAGITGEERERVLAGADEAAKRAVREASTAVLDTLNDAEEIPGEAMADTRRRLAGAILAATRKVGDRLSGQDRADATPEAHGGPTPAAPARDADHDLMVDATRFALTESARGRLSPVAIQRRFSLTAGEVFRLLGKLEQRGIIEPGRPAQSREVLIGEADVEEHVSRPGAVDAPEVRAPNRAPVRPTPATPEPAHRPMPDVFGPDTEPPTPRPATPPPGMDPTQPRPAPADDVDTFVDNTLTPEERQAMTPQQRRRLRRILADVKDRELRAAIARIVEQLPAGDLDDDYLNRVQQIIDQMLAGPPSADTNRRARVAGNALRPYANPNRVKGSATHEAARWLTIAVGRLGAAIIRGLRTLIGRIRGEFDARRHVSRIAAEHRRSDADRPAERPQGNLLAGVARFGTRMTSRPVWGRMNRADVDNGQVTPTVTTAPRVDRLSDGGPGQPTMDRLARVMDTGSLVGGPAAAHAERADRLRTSAQQAEREHRDAAARGAGPGDLARLKGTADSLRKQARRAFHDAAQAEASTTLAELSQVRPMGETPDARLNLTGDKKAVAALRWAAQFFPTDWIKAAAGRRWTVSTGERGDVDFDNGRITLADLVETPDDPSEPFIRNALHELTHVFEKALPELGAAQWAYHFDRTSTGRPGSRARTGENALRSMSVVNPGGGYDPDEFVRVDTYPDPYMGREYEDMTHFEVMSMLMESLFGGSQHTTPQMRQFALGVLADLGRQD